MQSGIFLLRYRTEMTDAGMPMPALVLRMPMPSYASAYNKKGASADKSSIRTNRYISKQPIFIFLVIRLKIRDIFLWQIQIGS
jgi:hypothetical protein